MAHATEVDSWDYDDDYDDNADALEAMEVASLQELYDEDHDVESDPIMAHTTKPVADSRGLSLIERLEREIAKRGVPDDCQYEIVVHDSKCITREEPIREALYLATVNILVRASSPGHAAGIIIFALSDYDRDDDALVDWDYAVQDRKRQYPRCVCLDLEPESIADLLERINIAEVLDHIAT